MEIIQGKKLLEMIEYFKQKSNQDPMVPAVVNALCYPVVSEFSQVFVNSQDPVDCTIMVLKVPLIEDILTLYSKQNTSKSITTSDQPATSKLQQHATTHAQQNPSQKIIMFDQSAVDELQHHATQSNRFFYQLWCKDIDNVTSTYVSNILQIYTPKAPIYNTHKLLAQLVTDRCGYKLENSITLYPNILLDTQSFNVSDRVDEDSWFDAEGYKLGNVKLQEFETQISPLYDTHRQDFFRLSIVLKLNCGIYYKKTNQLIGWVFLSEMGLINALHVVPEHRGKSLAEALVTRMVLLCKKIGIIPLGFTTHSRKSYLVKVGFQIYPCIEFVRAVTEQ